MEHGARAKFHGFHGEIPMLSMLAWNRKIVTVFPMKAWKAWNIKPWKTIESMESIEYKTMETMESMGIYKNESMESMGSMVFLVYY